MACRIFQIKDFSVFQNARTLFPSIWLGKLMINLNIRVSHFMMKIIELYLILRYRCVRVTDEGVIAIAQSCTSLEFLRYVIIWEVYSTWTFGTGWCIIWLWTCFFWPCCVYVCVCFPWNIVELECSLFVSRALECPPLHRLKVCMNAIYHFA